MCSHCSLMFPIVVWHFPNIFLTLLENIDIFLATPLSPNVSHCLEFFFWKYSKVLLDICNPFLICLVSLEPWCFFKVPIYPPMSIITWKGQKWDLLLHPPTVLHNCCHPPSHCPSHCSSLVKLVRKPKKSLKQKIYRGCLASSQVLQECPSKDKHWQPWHIYNKKE